MVLWIQGTCDLLPGSQGLCKVWESKQLCMTLSGQFSLRKRNVQMSRLPEMKDYTNKDYGCLRTNLYRQPHKKILLTSALLGFGTRYIKLWHNTDINDNRKNWDQAFFRKKKKKESRKWCSDLHTWLLVSSFIPATIHKNSIWKIKIQNSARTVKFAANKNNITFTCVLSLKDTRKGKLIH